MWGCVRLSRLITLGAALAFAGAAALADAAPGRVVSINLCTDQLAMMLAAPGQLVSVSKLAADPHSSAMAARPAPFPPTRAAPRRSISCAPIWWWQAPIAIRPPSGCCAGWGCGWSSSTPRARSTTPATASRRWPGCWGAKRRARRSSTASMRVSPRFAATRRRHSAALYHPNGYSLGGGTLSDDILRAAGFDNVARSLGLRGGGTLPLERLVMAAPDLLIRSTPLPGASRSEAVMTHPALAGSPPRRRACASPRPTGSAARRMCWARWKRWWRARGAGMKPLALALSALVAALFLASLSIGPAASARSTGWPRWSSAVTGRNRW